MPLCDWTWHISSVSSSICGTCMRVSLSECDTQVPYRRRVPKSDTRLQYMFPECDELHVVILRLDHIVLFDVTVEPIISVCVAIVAWVVGEVTRSLVEIQSIICFLLSRTKPQVWVWKSKPVLICRCSSFLPVSVREHLASRLIVKWLLVCVKMLATEIIQVLSNVLLPDDLWCGSGSRWIKDEVWF